MAEGKNSITVLQGENDWMRKWEVLCVKQKDTPMPCFFCDRSLVDMAQIGAWKLHTASPICVWCVEKYEVETTTIDKIEEERINPPE